MRVTIDFKDQAVHQNTQMGEIELTCEACRDTVLKSSPCAHGAVEIVVAFSEGLKGSAYLCPACYKAVMS